MRRTTDLDAAAPDLTAQVVHAIRDRQTVHVHGHPSARARLAAALLAAEKAAHRSLTIRTTPTGWTITR